MTAGPVQVERPKFDIGDIVRRHRAQLEAEHPLTPEQKRVLTDIGQCRTAVLGGHVDHCPNCGDEHPTYNSCRNRHCPKCQAIAQEQWIAERAERLLDVGHYHIVFTHPSELRPLAQIAPREVYNALLRAAAKTLCEFGESHLDVQIGATLVLHTWTREMNFHPHVHAIVTAGGLSFDQETFRHADRRYLFPVEAMGKVFRGKVLAALSEAYAAGAFAHSELFRDPLAFSLVMAKAAKLSWNVHAEAPFGDAQHVLAYLGRYTHRVAIANSRLLDVTEEHVVFRTRDDATETLSPVEFLRRFVQHVLPDDFHKIRHIGLYASPRLAIARERLGMPPRTPLQRPSWQDKLRELTGRDVRRCPRCLTPLARFTLQPAVRAPPLAIAA